MPTSNPDKIPFVVKRAMELKPRTILDIGIGFGKYGLLLREYLEFWGGNGNEESLKREHWKTRLVGVEIHPPLVMSHHRFLYDEILVGDVRDLAKKGELGEFDLCLCCDVLEHMPKDDALEVLEHLKTRCRHIIVTAPYGYVKQGPSFGNPWEKHVCGWTPDEFSRIGFTVLERNDFIFAVR